MVDNQPLAAHSELMPNVTVAAAHVHAACLDLCGGRRGTRIELTALRAALPLSRAAVDAALIELSRIGELALFPADDARERTEARRAAALDLCGVLQHFAYIG